MLGKLKNNKGFTIIEVLIVLAIAGLIMLIVFLAVPALQRNARNTTARNEAAVVLGATNEFMTNNNGKLPAASSSGTANSDAAKVWANVKTQQLSSITIEAETGTTVPTSTNAVVALTATCASATSTNDATGRGAITSGGNSRQLAIIYVTETGSTTQLSCTEG
jgi:prepilin-type N-terminal cleavage/methylation domain-containing protein